MTTVGIVESAVLSVDCGCDLLSSTGAFVTDISADLTAAGSWIERRVDDTIHGTCELILSRRLAWGSDRVRPWITLTDHLGNAQTWYLGVYVLTTPERRAGESPQTYAVQGYDLLHILTAPYGSTYALASGAVVLTAIGTLLTAAGGTNALSQAAIASTLPAAKVWPLDDKVTTLSIINELLAIIGYESLWVDRDGRWRADPLVADAVKSPVWAYDADSATTTVGEDRAEQADYFAAPNRWVFVNDDAATLPTEGAGIYTVSNAADGPTSIAARGRTINRVVHLKAANQTALVTQADIIVAADKRVARTVELTAAPNPTHWHNEVVTFTDPALGASGTWKVTGWTLPLDGGDMSLSLEAV